MGMLGHGVRKAPDWLEQQGEQGLDAANQGLLEQMGAPMPKFDPSMNLKKAIIGAVGGLLTNALSKNREGGSFAQGYERAHMTKAEQQYKSDLEKAEQKREVAKLQAHIAAQKAQRQLQMSERIRGSQEKGLDRQWEREKFYEQKKNVDADNDRLSQGQAEGAVRGYQSRLDSFWNRADTITDADRAEMAAEKAAILAQFKNLDPNRLRDLPDSKTIAKRRIEDQKERFRQTHELAKQRFSWAKEKDRDISARGWAQIEVSAHLLQKSLHAEDRMTAQFYLNQMDGGSKKLIDQADGKIRGLDAQIAGLKAKAAKAKVLERKDINAKIAELEGQRENWAGVKSEANDKRVTFGLQEIERMARESREGTPSVAPRGRGLGNPGGGRGLGGEIPADWGGSVPTQAELAELARRGQRATQDQRFGQSAQKVKGMLSGMMRSKPKPKTAFYNPKTKKLEYR